MQFHQFVPEAQIPTTSSTGRKKILALTLGVLGVAAIACVALAFVGTGNQRLNGEELSLSRSTEDVDLESFDINESTIELFSVKKHTHKFIKKLRKILLGLLSTDSTSKKRAANLILGFGFELIDSDSSKSVSSQEWKAFVSSIFPDDTEKLSALFAQVNNGSEFNLAQFTAFVTKQLKQSQNDDDSDDIVLNTDLKTSALTFARLIINDKTNYIKAYTLLFQIYDLDDSKTITKEEYSKAVHGLGAKEEDSVKQAKKLFKFAQQQKFSDDGETIKFASFSEYALSIQDDLKARLKNEKSKLPNLDDSRQKPSIRKEQRHNN